MKHNPHSEYLQRAFDGHQPTQTTPPEVPQAAHSDAEATSGTGRPETAGRPGDGNVGPPVAVAEDAARVLGVHECVWIDHEVGYDCGCNESGTLHSLKFRGDALRHQAQMLADAGLLDDPEEEAMVAAENERLLQETADLEARAEAAEAKVARIEALAARYHLAAIYARTEEQRRQLVGAIHDITAATRDDHA